MTIPTDSLSTRLPDQQSMTDSQSTETYTLPISPSREDGSGSGCDITPSRGRDEHERLLLLFDKDSVTPPTKERPRVVDPTPEKLVLPHFGSDQSDRGTDDAESVGGQFAVSDFEEQAESESVVSGSCEGNGEQFEEDQSETLETYSESESAYSNLGLWECQHCGRRASQGPGSCLACIMEDMPEQETINTELFTYFSPSRSSRNLGLEPWTDSDIECLTSKTETQ